MDKIAILDAGAQYGKVIDRKVRALRVCSEMLPLNTPSDKLKEYKAIIISGSPGSVYKEALAYNKNIFTLGIPVLGICYGMQLINHHFGGKVDKKDIREDGQEEITITKDSSLFRGLEKKQKVLLTHGDSVLEPAPKFLVTSMSGDIISSIESPGKTIYGVQFHPEVDLTENGDMILENFIVGISGLSQDFTIKDRIEGAIKKIKQDVGDKHVICLVSGGVDSAVCTALLEKALKPEQVHAIHVDTGFMRMDESNLVKKAMENQCVNLKIIDAEQRFLDAKTNVEKEGVEKEIGPLKEIIDPEKKRQIIGDTFISIVDDEIEGLLKNNDALSRENILMAQGTLRPDLIESASPGVSKSASTIKTHHNDTSTVRKLRDEGKVIEPLSDYHKDEVREIGRQLGLNEAVVSRQPFPGPGLAIRILCADKYIDKCTDKTPTQEDKGSVIVNINKIIKEDYSCDILPIKTVGVQGDSRTYSNAVVLSARDTNNKSDQDWNKLFTYARDVPKHIHSINRVVFNLSDNECFNIAQTRVDEGSLELIRKADFVVNKILDKHGLMQKLSQVPVILVPIGDSKNKSIAIRPIITNDFMTGVAAIPGKDIPIKVIDEIAREVISIDGISNLFYDMTSKPPGTTEWE